MNQLKYILLIVLSILIYSCEQKKIETKKNLIEESTFHLNTEDKNEHFTKFRSEKIVHIDKRGKKKIEAMTYSINCIPAIEFIERKGKVVDSEDLESLKNEQVFILEMELENEMQSVFESKRLQLEKNKIIEYINGNIINDIWVEQNGKDFRPSGHQYENSFGKQNRMRIYFYFKGINLKNNFRTIFNDHLFGSGLINFRIQANHDL